MLFLKLLLSLGSLVKISGSSLFFSVLFGQNPQGMFLNNLLNFIRDGFFFHILLISIPFLFNIEPTILDLSNLTLIGR